MTDKIKVTFTPKAKLENAISILARDAGRIQDRIHNLGCSIHRVWLEEGEAFAQEACEYFNNLMEASPYHTQAFSVWIGANTNLYFSEEVGKFYVNDADAESKVVYPRQFKEGRDTPFWKLKPAAKANPYVALEAFEKALQSAMKHAKKPKEGDVIDMTLVREVSAAVSAAKARAA